MQWSCLPGGLRSGIRHHDDMPGKINAITGSRLSRPPPSACHACFPLVHARFISLAFSGSLRSNSGRLPGQSEGQRCPGSDHCGSGSRAQQVAGWLWRGPKPPGCCEDGRDPRQPPPSQCPAQRPAWVSGLIGDVGRASGFWPPR